MPSSDSLLQNGLLARLAAADLQLLEPHLEAVTLPRLGKLEYPDRRIDSVYFVERGIVSIVAALNSKDVEIGIIGFEGVTGLPVINGGDRSPYSAYMQVAGNGRRMPAHALRTAMEASPNLHNVLLRYAQAFMIQVSQTAVANARANIESRLARWLLMAQDRVGSNGLPLTHEFLSLMMGAGRPGVTEAIHALANLGLVRGERGTVVILDRPGLIERAGQYYGVPEREYERLLLHPKASLHVV